MVVDIIVMVYNYMWLMIRPLQAVVWFLVHRLHRFQILAIISMCMNDAPDEIYLIYLYKVGGKGRHSHGGIMVKPDCYLLFGVALCM